MSAVTCGKIRILESCDTLPFRPSSGNESKPTTAPPSGSKQKKCTPLLIGSYLIVN